MEHSITIALRYLRAARLFTAKHNPCRPFLEGVALSRGYIVGSNGHMIGAIRCEAVQGAPEVIIPNEAIDFYLKKIKGQPGESVTIEWGDDREGRITNHVVEEQFKAQARRYLVLEDVLARHTAPVGNPQFQWSYLVVFEKAAEVLGIPKKHMHKAFLLPGGDEGPARIFIPGFPEFIGSVMPLRWSQRTWIEEQISNHTFEELV